MYVTIADRMYGKYFVEDKSKTYRFRLTIWDPRRKERVDIDHVYVDINGGMIWNQVISDNRIRSGLFKKIGSNLSI